MARVWGVLRSGSSRLLYCPHVALVSTLASASGISIMEGRSFREVLCLVSRRNWACLLHDQHPTPAGTQTSHNYRNDHLIVGQVLRSFCGRASLRVRCCPPPMAWQEAARNLASREVKVYERIQDGMLTNTRCDDRCNAVVLPGLNIYIDGRVHALIAVPSDNVILTCP